MKASRTMLLLAGLLAGVLASSPAVPDSLVQATMRAAAAKVALLEARVTALEARSAASGSHGTSRITPELKPVSDKKFFDGKVADYPTDDRPTYDDSFNHPYPLVQGSSTYDKDYVADENQDGGEWATHQEYDELRKKMADRDEKIRKAKAKEAKEEEEKKKADEAEKKAAEDAKNATAAAEKAEEVEKKAEDDAKKANTSVTEADEVVKKEEQDLIECKRQLEEAKKELEKLQGSSFALRTRNEKASNFLREAQKSFAESERKEKEISLNIAKNHGRRQEAKKSKEQAYKDEVNDIKKTEAELEEAAKELRKHRNPDKGGAVFRSGAAPRACVALAGLGLAFAAVA